MFIETWNIINKNQNLKPNSNEYYLVAFRLFNFFEKIIKQI